MLDGLYFFFALFEQGQHGCSRSGGRCARVGNGRAGGGGGGVGRSGRRARGGHGGEGRRRYCDGCPSKCCSCSGDGSPCGSDRPGGGGRQGLGRRRVRHVLPVVAPWRAIEGGLVAAPLRHALLHVLAVVATLSLLEGGDEALHGRSVRRLVLLETLRRSTRKTRTEAATQVSALGLGHPRGTARSPRSLVKGAVVVVQDGGLYEPSYDIVAVLVGMHSVLGHPLTAQVHVRALVPEHVEDADRWLKPVFLGYVVQRHVQAIDPVPVHAVGLVRMARAGGPRVDGRYGNQVDLWPGREVLEEFDQLTVVQTKGGLEGIFQGVAGPKLHEDQVGHQVLHRLELLPSPDARACIFQHRDIWCAIVVHTVARAKQFLQLGWEGLSGGNTASHDCHISLGHAGANANDFLARYRQSTNFLHRVPCGSGQALLVKGCKSHDSKQCSSCTYHETPP
mmetsp:Transcript_132604/g.412302  ORF Transcript_132604/g.412302 Transcript_132604/m.412302 type:complete len:450 (-) Transcript_132604:237-1586(-)